MEIKLFFNGLIGEPGARALWTGGQAAVYGPKWTLDRGATEAR
jgi:hypothetical protein